MKYNTPYITLRNIGPSYVEWYSRQLRDYTSCIRRLVIAENLETRQDFARILRQAHGIYGVRSRAFEIFSERTTPISGVDLQSDALALLAILELIVSDPSSEAKHRLEELLNTCGMGYPNIERNFVITWSGNWEPASVRNSVFWMTAAQAGNRPWIHMDYEKFSFARRKARAAAAVQPSPTSSQQEALSKLILLHQLKTEGLSAGGITPSLHPLILGSSGAGKSFVVRALADRLALPLFETTVSSWAIQGGRAQVSTARRLASFLRTEGREGAVLFIDELDKLRPSERSSEYTRYLLDELMGMLSGITERWDGWCPETTEILRTKVFVICAGTFQNLYQHQSSKLPSQTWQQLSIADHITEQNYLPEELMMRLASSVIEILPPSVHEVKTRMEQIHMDMNVPLPASEVLMAAAVKIQAGRCNMRGLQGYLTGLALARQEQLSASSAEARSGNFISKASLTAPPNRPLSRFLETSA